MQDIRLLEIITPSKTTGMLSKAIYSVDGVECYVKGNSDNIKNHYGYEPYSEAMAYIIANTLGIPCVPYWLYDARLFPAITTVGGIRHVSVCPSFTRDGETIKTVDYLLKEKYTNRPMHDKLKAYRSFLPSYDLDRILLFDAYIGNADRHLNNIEFIVGVDNVPRMAPIYDNGASLLALIPDLKLYQAKKKWSHDTSKPFRPNHRTQTELIENEILKSRNLDELHTTVIKGITPVLRLLPPERADAIVAYLYWRRRYLVKGMRYNG